MSLRVSVAQAQAWLGAPPLRTPRASAADADEQAAAACAPEPSSGPSGGCALRSARGMVFSARLGCGSGARRSCRGAGRHETAQGPVVLASELVQKSALQCAWGSSTSIYRMLGAD